MEAIASRVKAIASRLETMDAIASRLEAIATRVEAITTSNKKLLFSRHVEAPTVPDTVPSSAFAKKR